MQLAPPSLRGGLPSSYDAPIASGPRVHPLGRSARPGGAHLCARLWPPRLFVVFCLCFVFVFFVFILLYFVCCVCFCFVVVCFFRFVFVLFVVFVVFIIPVSRLLL